MSTEDDIKYDVKKDLNIKLERPVLKRSAAGYVNNERKFIEFENELTNDFNFVLPSNAKYKASPNVDSKNNKNENFISK